MGLAGDSRSPQTWRRWVFRPILVLRIDLALADAIVPPDLADYGIVESSGAVLHILHNSAHGWGDDAIWSLLLQVVSRCSADRGLKPMAHPGHQRTRESLCDESGFPRPKNSRAENS